MRLVLLELNEINFDAVRHYLSKGIELPGFKKMFDEGLYTTTSESIYENLEPWIQWPSAHTGLSYEQHKVFRLGDFVNADHEQIFEKIESKGFSVGAISPMNASNNLKRPAYFIPDPWTETKSDGSFLSKNISSAISQAVNDNSQSKLTLSTIFSLILAFFIYVRPSRYIDLFIYALSSLGRSWRKALFLDKFLHEIHLTKLKRSKPDFSTLFLNAGAHIQHHYFYNSDFVEDESLKNPNWYIDENEDPFLEMLKVYDLILNDLHSIKNLDLIVATGLSQSPYNEVKFYYRLKNHKKFLSDIGISFSNVVPRMTRDFLIKFDSPDDLVEAEEILSKIYIDEIKMFSEIDNRGNDLFVVLTYPKEITSQTKMHVDGKQYDLLELVSFVAIKNGEHNPKGYLYLTKGIKKGVIKNNDHVSNIYNLIYESFVSGS